MLAKPFWQKPYILTKAQSKLDKMSLTIDFM